MWLLALNVLAILCFSCFGQQVRTGINNPPITSFRDYLKAHNIGTSEADLTAALHDGNPQTRSVAAYVLSEQKLPGADAAITAAIAQERDEKTKIDMASALMQSGNPVGFSVLADICSSQNTPTNTALMATTYLLLFKEGKSCIPMLLERLKAQQPDIVAQALSLAGTAYEEATREQQLKIIEAFKKGLQNKSAYVRLMAADVFSQTDPTAAVPALEAASKEESDKDIRDSLEEAAARARKALKP